MEQSFFTGQMSFVPPTPSVSKHWREPKALTPTSGLTSSSFLHPPPDSSWKGPCALYNGSPSPIPVSFVMHGKKTKTLRPTTTTTTAAARLGRQHLSRIYTTLQHSWTLTTWLSDSALVSINKVTPRRAQLVLGWMIICGRVNHLGL